MGEVVNLRLQRKRAVRRAAEAEAAENRTAHGLPKAIRDIADRRTAAEARRLDGHRLDGAKPAAVAAADEVPSAERSPDDAR